MDFTFHMPRPPAFIGRLACCHCISLMLTLLMLIKHERKVASMLSRTMCLAQGEGSKM